MTVAAFVLGVLGFGIAAASLTWQVYTFLIQGARPKLTPVIGMLAGVSNDMLLTNDGTRDIRVAMASATAQFQRAPMIVGVKVVNAGRAPFHVAGWAIRADPSGTSFNVLGRQLGSPQVPCDISPGAEERFFMDFDAAVALRSGADQVEGTPQRIVATVSSGGRTFVSKPIAPVNMMIGQT